MPKSAARSPRRSRRNPTTPSEWIGEYASDAYQEVAAAAIAQLDRLAARAMTEARFAELAAIFATASRLEADFWQMGLDAA